MNALFRCDALIADMLPGLQVMYRGSAIMVCISMHAGGELLGVKKNLTALNHVV